MNNLEIFGPVEEVVMEQMTAAIQKSNAVYGVLCADNHLGYCLPVGSVIALEKAICVNGVGYDIACGNKAVLLDADANYVKKNISKIMDEVFSKISFGVGRANNEKVDHDLFDHNDWREISILRNLKDKALQQLGTVGSGNHYVDIFTDELNMVWVGVHFGSRGLGHSIATHFLKEGGGKDGIHADPVIFDEDSDLGSQYIRCMEMAGRYAYAGRDWVCSRVAQILGSSILSEVHNHHNFAWRERHFDKDLWVIRKGSTPLFTGQKGFVGGSMGDISVILHGVESGKSKSSLYSTIHGAGRAMGRMAAKGKKDKKGNVIKEGLIKQEDHQTWIKRAEVEVRGGGLDESPLAYKRIEEVLKFHEETVEIVHVLKPIGVAMAPEKCLDPYKD